MTSTGYPTLNWFSITEKRPGSVVEFLKQINRWPLIQDIHPSPRDYTQVGHPIPTMIRWGDKMGEVRFSRSFALDHQGNIIVSDEKGENSLQIFDQEGKLIKAITLPLWYSEKPRSVAVDHDNNIVVCDHDTSTFFVYNHQGTILKKFVLRGSDPGQFLFPRGIAIDHNNNIIVCDTRNNRIQIIDHDGKLIKRFGSSGKGEGQFNFPFDVITDRHHNILVCDHFNHRVQIFDQEGNYIKSLGVECKDPEMIQELESRRNSCYERGGFDYDAGRLIIERGECLESYDENGKLIQQRSLVEFGPGKMFGPRVVAVDSHDNIIVGDSKYLNCFQIFDDQGNHIKSFGSTKMGPFCLYYPTGLAIDRQGNIVSNVHSSDGCVFLF